MKRFWNVSQKWRILPPCRGIALHNNVVAWPCYPGVSMWAPTPLMAWYCDQSRLIIRKRWTLSQSFTWFPPLPASLFYFFCLLSDTYDWFYGFIILQWVFSTESIFLTTHFWVCRGFLLMEMPMSSWVLEQPVIALQTRCGFQVS